MPPFSHRLHPLLPWLLVALYHFIVFGLFAEMFSPALIDLPLLAGLGLLMRRRPALAPLFWCFACVCANLLCEPSTGIGPFMWVAFVPLFIVIHREARLSRLFAMGLWTGLLIAGGVYTWLIPSLSTFFDWPAAAAWPPYLFASAIIGGHFAIFLPLARWLCDRLRWPVALIAPALFTLLEFWWPVPMPIDSVLAFVWWPVWLQLASVIGPQGVILIAAIVNVLIFTALTSVKYQGRRAVNPAMFAAAAIILAVTLHGLWAMARHAPRPGAPEVRVALIQPMAPLKILNADTARQADAAAALRDLSLDAHRAALAAGHPLDLIIWPEGAGPFAARAPEFNPVYMDAVRAVQQITSAPLLLHNIEFAPSRPGESRPQYYSAVSLVEPVARPAADYRKVMLMPFSEYLPLERALPILRRLLPQSRTILRGESPVLLPAPGGPAAPLICYEVLYAEYIRREVSLGAGWIVNLTNDRWYGARQQPPQHLAFAVLAAVENRRPVVRATNSGISAIIGPDGRIAPDARTPTMQPAYLIGAIQPRTGPTTIYTRHGEALHLYILTPLYLLMLAVALFRRASAPPSGPSRPHRRKK